MRKTKAAEEAKDLARANFERAGREQTEAQRCYQVALNARAKAEGVEADAKRRWYDAVSAFSREAEELRKLL